VSELEVRALAEEDVELEARDPGASAAVPFRFDCHRCGNCCSGGQGFVWLADGETAELARALGMSEASFVASYVRRAIDPRTGASALALREDPSGGDAGGRCILLEAPNTCRAYDARPDQCRRFPHWPSVLSDPQAFETVRATCPGITVDAGDSVREHAFRRLAQRYADLERELSIDVSDELEVEPRDELEHRDEHGDPIACCLSRAESSEIFATALEADYAIAEMKRGSIGERIGGCLAGRARPLGCRLASAGCATFVEPVEPVNDPSRANFAAVRPSQPTMGDNADRTDERSARFHARLRGIVRETGYPAAYGRFRQLLRSRGMILDRETSPQ
jgi:Fe-S-cluster containining protein